MAPAPPDPTEATGDLPVCVVQRAASLDPEQNRAALGVVADVVRDRPRPLLVAFPEAFARDFGGTGADVSQHAEPLDGPFVRRLADLAAEHDVTLVAGMFETSEDPERPYNTLVVVGPDGLRTSYRKIHLYDSFGYQESRALSAGAVDQRPVLEVAGSRVGLITCYDLRFPEAARRYAGDIDLLVVPAAWVAGPRKVQHWRTLLTARAIENLVYVAGAGQPGPRYSGTSIVVDPRGDVLAEAGMEPETITAEIDPAIFCPETSRAM